MTQNQQLTEFLDWFAPETLHPELQAALFTGPLGQGVGHPLVHQPFYDPQLNRMLNQQLEQKQTLVKEAYSAGNWFRYIWLHEKPYRLQVLWGIHQILTPEEYWPLVADVWTNVENHWQHKRIIPKIFKAKPERYALIMSNEERQVLESYDGDIFTIYRGHQLHNAAGWSWTFSPTKAEWFAKRFCLDDRWAVTKATVRRTSIIAFFNNRGENEVVVNSRATTPEPSLTQILSKADADVECARSWAA